jgi:hypothetical protein
MPYRDVHTTKRRGMLVEFKCRGMSFIRFFKLGSQQPFNTSADIA